jgi:hypothetical protein
MSRTLFLVFLLPLNVDCGPISDVIHHDIGRNTGHAWGCYGMTFSPEPDAESITNLAVARWASTHGCLAMIGGGGIPVTVSDTVHYDGDVLCGATHMWYYRGNVVGIKSVRILSEYGADVADLNCPQPKDIMLHEAGHCFAPRADHSQTGVFTRVASGDYAINEDSLVAICADLDCQKFEPEEK